ncbi:MAG TPA: glycosyltransferase [Pirellulales bacterium]|jgi:glycosyltransferase involved in cell wall biosynthesis|nr:glycosyltransferase [Pirellulales bacterium]
MRVLFTGHHCLDAWPQGWWLRDLGRALTWAGHEVRGLVTAGQVGGNDPFAVARVVCRAGDLAADLDFAPPCFASEGGSSQTFDSLSDVQITRYRDAWRHRLDREVDDFNPHVIHAGHLWWDAQLALETGVPYVVSAWSAELTACADRPRARALAQQAAENASRIFVPHHALGVDVQTAFGIAPDHIAVLPPAVDCRAVASRGAQAARKDLLDRFGLPATSQSISAERIAAQPIIVARATPDVDGGLDTVLNAAARCQAAQGESAAGAPLTIVAGPAEANPQLAAQAARLGLEHFAEVQIRSGGDWLALCQAADLALFPYRGPANGLDVLWALAAGTPAIVTVASGLDWLSHCPAARMIADGDHELLADAMLDALAGSWKNTQGAAGVDFVRRHHAIEAAAEHVAEVYRSVLTQRFGQLPPH